MKMIFLKGFDGNTIAINSDYIGHIDKASDQIVGQCLMYMTYQLTIKLAGSPKAVGMEIQRQLSGNIEQ